MSEPMSSGDIEDVLSSIRRLVSEDLRPVAKPAEGARTVAAEPAGKLLLTPALRVVATHDGGARLATFSAADRPSPTAVKPDPTLRAVQGDDEEAAVVEAAAPDLTDILPTPPTVTEPAAVEPDTSMPETAEAETAATDEDWLPESQDDEQISGWAQTKTAALDNAEATSAAASILTRVVSEIGAGVSEVEDDWEPETGDAPVSSLSWHAPEWVEEAELADDGEFADGFDAEMEDSFAKSAADLAEDAAVAEIMARAAAGKSQAKREPAKVEPVHEATKPEATKPEATKPEVTKPEAAKDDIFAEDEGVFDETVLRDLVRDLIREELSGTLGERITRNVRKLVRAEINRALTARDFD